MRSIIVYFGIIQYEDNNAMCQHSNGIKRLIEANGYTAISIGVSSSVRRGTYKMFDSSSYMINYPQNMKESVLECVSANDIKMVLSLIGLEKIKSLIMADYRYFPMIQMLKFCKKNGIYFVVDIMDRFVSGSSIISKIKKMDSELRIKYLYPKIERRIHICKIYNDLLGDGKHIGVIPGLTYVNYDYKVTESSNERIKLVFLGSPGMKCEKERIDWVIKAIFENQLSNQFDLIFAGFDEKVFLKSNSELEEYITKNTSFLGRISHEDCIKLLCESDFSLIIRENNILSQYGFSTKIGEAFSCGIPVLVTDTSDNSLYVHSGKNGFICKATYENVSEMIISISTLKREQIDNMKYYVKNNNSLYFKNYIDVFSRIVISE